MDSSLDILDARVIWIIISCQICVTHHFISNEEKRIPEKSIVWLAKSEVNYYCPK